MCGWTRPEFETERIRARRAGLCTGVTEAADGRCVLHVVIPPVMRIGAIGLTGPDERCAVIHKSPKPGYRVWQLSFFVGTIMGGDASFDTVQEALDHARGLGLVLDEVKAL